MIKVYVITNTENGWDCVLRVYKERSDAVKYCAEWDGVSLEEWDEHNSILHIHEKQLN